MAVITTDFDEIQVRNIDPHSPVTSENHNKLLKTFGNFKMYVDGFGITFDLDVTAHRATVTLDPGIAFVQYMVIEMLSQATLELCEIPSTEAQYCIVLEYTYRAVKPVPIAYLKVIRSENFNEENQLLLYTVDIPRWDYVPTYGDFMEHLYGASNKSPHLIDCRRQIKNTPSWANTTYLRLDGQNQASAILKMDGEPTNDNDLVNLAYVDKRIRNHSDEHNAYFVRKNSVPDSDDWGKVIDNIDIKPVNEDPVLRLSDSNNKGLEFKVDSNGVTETITKGNLTVKVGNRVVSQINSSGITGALWNADIAEYFVADDSIVELPEEGSCICVHHGKAVLSSEEGDPSVIGCVSYHPAYILGGSTDFKKEFEENHKIPVAVLGQIKNVPYYSDYNLETGGLLVSGKNGKFKVISHYDPIGAIYGCILGKAMNSVYPCYGSHYNRVDILIK